MQTLMALVSAFLLLAATSGCTLRHYRVEKDRVDQDLAIGNQGFLNGAVPATMEATPRRTTRQTYVTEIELPGFKKPVEAAAPNKTAAVPETVATGQETIPSETYSPELTTAEDAMTSEVVEPKPQQFTTYKVQGNDTLEKISKKLYGTTKHWKAIYDANRDVLKAPDKIYPGQMINVPVLELKEPKENLK